MKRPSRDFRNYAADARPTVKEFYRLNHCGLENVHMSWGHDEYLHHVVKDHVPVHREGQYDHLMNDREMPPCGVLSRAAEVLTLMTALPSNLPPEKSLQAAEPAY